VRPAQRIGQSTARRRRRASWNLAGRGRGPRAHAEFPNETPRPASAEQRTRSKSPTGRRSKHVPTARLLEGLKAAQDVAYFAIEQQRHPCREGIDCPHRAQDIASRVMLPCNPRPIHKHTRVLAQLSPDSASRTARIIRAPRSCRHPRRLRIPPRRRRRRPDGSVLPYIFEAAIMP